MPSPPDPAEVAGAQTANNIGTAVANQVMGSVNQITPSGSLTYYFNGPNGELIAPGDYSPSAGSVAGPAATNFTDTKYEDTLQIGPNTIGRPEPAPEVQGDFMDQLQAQVLMQGPLGEGSGYELLPPGGSGGGTSGGTASAPSGTVGNELDLIAAGGSAGSGGGGFQWTDPNTGDTYTIPQMTAVTKLSPEEQRVFDASQGARGNLAELGQTVSGQMQDHFATPFTLDGLPAAGSAGALSAPTYQGIDGLRGVQSRAGGLITDFGSADINAGSVGNIQIADSGEILRDFGDAGDITRTYGTDFSEDRRRVEEALMSRLNPSLDRDRETLRTSLLNQGIREGSEAYDRAMNRANEASTDARMQAILAGGQEQTRLADLEARRAGFENAAQQQAFGQLYNRASFSNQGQQQLFGQNEAQAGLDFRVQDGNANRGLQASIANSQQDLARMQASNQAALSAFGMDMSAAGFNNENLFRTADFNNSLADRGFANDAFMQDRMDADRARALQETLLSRNQPINEIGALLGTGQVSMPSFVNTSAPQIPTVDRAGLEMDGYQNQMDAWEQQQAMLGSIYGTAGDIGTAAILASDRRLKEDVERVGSIGPLPVYTYRYLGGERLNIGFMADEVAEVAPGAVVYRDGFAFVDYGKALEAV